MRIVHISDLHFGPYYKAVVGESLLDSLTQLRPEAVLITGDFTQRAKREQFVQAAAFLERVRAISDTIVSCPGNHDIALFRLWERIFHPFKLYQTYIHPELNQVSDLPDARLVALNSVKPLRKIIEGEISSKQIEMLKSTLNAQPCKLFRVLALHHPPDFHSPDKSLSRRETRFVKACLDAEVDLVLSGHVHESRVFHIGPQQEGESQRGRTLLIGCGTTTSRRGRWTEKDQNTFRLIDGNASEISICTLRYSAARKIFESEAPEIFPKLFRPHLTS